MKSVDAGAAATTPPSRGMIAAAFAAIYLIWGSTYLAIKFAIETVPPFLMTGTRFFIAGAVLYAWSVARASRSDDAQVRARAWTDSARGWKHAFTVGALLIVGGTALVGWAELSVPSGITSLILASNPLWMVLLESGERGRLPARRVIAGVVVGLVGLAILIGPSLATPGAGAHLLGIAALLVAALTWSIGALYSRRVATNATPARSTGMQMMAGALLSLGVAFVLGEHERVSLDAITPASMFAIAYLVVAGALIGFTAYLWLMRVSTPSRVATHAYVNPVVAVLLGWGVAGEAITMRTGAAMAVIVVAVILIVSAPVRAAVVHATGDAPRPHPRHGSSLARRAA